MRLFGIKNNWRNSVRFVGLAALAALFAFSFNCMAQDEPTAHKTKNVVIVMMDGMRWQEIFGGADLKLINKHGPRLLASSGKRSSQARELYWRETSTERREALMPFLWGVMAKKGQIYGNRNLGSDSHVANRMKFSYPGYNETLTGAPDDRHIHSNREIDNPNVTVLEWLNKKPAYHGKVAAFGAWEVFDNIFNTRRCDFLVNAGYEPVKGDHLTPEIELLNELKADQPRIWDDEPFDALPFYTAMEYLRASKPRVMFIGLGETDDWGHMGAYSEYLNSAHRDDEYLRKLWDQLQSMPEYRDQTTLIVLPDHGRGRGNLWGWHGWPFPGSGQTWMAFMGPDTAAFGEREMAATVTESQVAATVAALLGEDYGEDVTKAARPILDILPSSVGQVAGVVAQESTPGKRTFTGENNR